ncbi:hypothetical protein GWI33_019993 [Rhynchophorus ferrugineus]|uniref:TIMELESS-interacting protein n=1 Tax=Rhynchophorus ferrugineus TaxID=354439 RepID=A0A834M3S1_RHYFE|nr:hypothetical protein GWI33_019993 [Rhynchophorus ferrugineus]
MSSDGELLSERENSEPEDGLVLKDHDSNENEAEEVSKDEEGEEQKKVVKPKRVVRNPQPKLNEETLKGVRGLSAIESYFERARFKGKGYEDKDINVIMKTYEYWCHRLFPKFPFDTCIERLEKLGTKKATQTHIKRIRYNLIVEDKPIIDDSDEEQNIDDTANVSHNEEITEQRNDQFDKLMAATKKIPDQLTEEQLERIRLNKEKAEKLRQERLEKIRNKAGEKLIVSSQLPTTSLTCGESEEVSEMSSIQTNNEDDRTNLNSSQKSEEMELMDVENMIEDEDSTFNHESNIKGKSNITGKTIKKKSRNKPPDTSLSNLQQLEDDIDEHYMEKDLSNNGLETDSLEKKVLRETQDNNLEDEEDSNDQVPKIFKKRAAVIDSDDDL